uniref:Major facilitator superfamily (MFS) profile domain-containing protein n=1 Tax=Mycena chlorophos TaxID=658473 RepID=A0ABQ0LSG4_MYCCL|nr:predicted protein [Mycena chlorophos]
MHSESDPLRSRSPASYSAVDSTPPRSPTLVEPQAPLNVFSSTDTAWILSAIYCAVFLGAFDGTRPATRTIEPADWSRYRRGDLVDAHIQRLQQIDRCLVYWHFLSPVPLLLHSTLWYCSRSAVVRPLNPTIGRLADILGRKGAMLLALFFFGMHPCISLSMSSIQWRARAGSGTVFCGIASSMEALILARAVAGIGGGGRVFPLLFQPLFAPLTLPPQGHDSRDHSAERYNPTRGLYQGLTNLLYGLGAGLGGPLSGWINDRWGWRAAFYFQAPLMIFSATLVSWKVNIRLPSEIEDQPLLEKLQRIDILGSFTLVGFVGCLLLGVSLKSTEELPWSHPLIYGLLVVSVISGISFVLVEKYWAVSPVMPLHLLMQRTPFAVSVSNLWGSMVAFSMLYNVPLVEFSFFSVPKLKPFQYLSAVKLYSSTSAGAHLIPHSIAIPCGSVAAGWLMRRTGKLYALTVAAAASSLFANVLVAFWNGRTAPFHLWADLIPQALGMAAFITSTLIAMIAGVTREDMPVATGITYLFRTTGQVLGVSLSGAVVQSVLVEKLRQRIHDPHSAEIIYEIRRVASLGSAALWSKTEFYRHSAASISTLPAKWRAIAVESYGDALRAVFILQAALSLLCLLSSLPIQENPLPGSPAPVVQSSESDDGASESDLRT